MIKSKHYRAVQNRIEKLTDENAQFTRRAAVILKHIGGLEAITQEAMQEEYEILKRKIEDNHETIRELGELIK